MRCYMYTMHMYLHIASPQSQVLHLCFFVISELVSLLRGSLEKGQGNRFSIDDVTDHPWTNRQVQRHHYDFSSLDRAAGRDHFSLFSTTSKLLELNEVYMYQMLNICTFSLTILLNHISSWCHKSHTSSFFLS